VPDDAHPTRAALLSAGLALAETGSLAATSVDHVVRAAGVSKGTFYVHFADRAAYLAALHRAFYAEVGTRIGAALSAHQPGADRLRAGASAYLDTCLDARGVKAMLLDIRSEPAIADQVRENVAGFAAIVTADFAALGAPAPAPAARLFTAMVQEVALAELQGGGADEDLRAALWRFSTR
jgi:TetR/AcrR family transcriptional regulator, transcriptional repressor for nem operon